MHPESKLIPKPKSAKDAIKNLKELKKFKKLSSYIVRAKNDGYPIESFIIAYQIIQEIEIPLLRKMILTRLNMKEFIRKFEDEKSAYSENLEYLALTHDIELFKLLEEARKIRNNLVHRLTEYENIEIACSITNKALKGIFRNLLKAIQDRWSGIKPIPVLTIYAAGWNDYRKQMFKNFGITKE